MPHGDDATTPAVAHLAHSSNPTSSSDSAELRSRSIFLHSFLEASLPTGEWDTALQALVSHNAHDATHLVAASKVQHRAGMWRNCLKLLRHYHQRSGIGHQGHADTSGGIDLNGETMPPQPPSSIHNPSAPHSVKSDVSSSLVTLNILAIRSVCQASQRGGDDGTLWELSVRLCANAMTNALAATSTPAATVMGKGRQREDCERLSSASSLVIATMPDEAHWEKKSLSYQRRMLLGRVADIGGTVRDVPKSQAHHELRRDAHGASSSPVTSVHGLPVIQANMHLSHILRYGALNSSSLARRNRSAWMEALGTFHSITPHPSIVSVNILAKILGNYRRDKDLFELLHMDPVSLMGPRARGHHQRSLNEKESGLGNTGKAFAEAAFECHAWRCGLALLELDRCRDTTADPQRQQTVAASLVATPLTPSAAIPALIALRQNKQVWNVALAWWWRNGGGGGGRAAVPAPAGGRSAAAAAVLLCHNQKVSSYVAQHIASATHAHLRGGGMTAKTSTHVVPHLTWYWQTALEIVGSTAHFHPARSILFAMQALHVSSCWVKAIELYQHKEEFLFEHGALELPTIQAILCDEGARKWIPGDVVLAMRHATWWKPGQRRH